MLAPANIDLRVIFTPRPRLEPVTAIDCLRDVVPTFARPALMLADFDAIFPEFVAVTAPDDNYILPVAKFSL